MLLSAVLRPGCSISLAAFTAEIICDRGHYVHMRPYRFSDPCPWTQQLSPSIRYLELSSIDSGDHSWSWPLCTHAPLLLYQLMPMDAAAVTEHLISGVFAGTSPLYSYQAVFTAPPDEQRVLSAASLFFWTLTLIVLVKYVAIVLRFDDNGEGDSVMHKSKKRSRILCSSSTGANTLSCSCFMLQVHQQRLLQRRLHGMQAGQAVGRSILPPCKQWSLTVRLLCSIFT